MENYKENLKNRALLVLCGESVVPSYQVVRSFIERIGFPKSINLLCTAEVQKDTERLADFLLKCENNLVRVSADRLASFLQSDSGGKCPLVTHDITKKLKSDNLPTVAEVYAGFEKEGPVAINISGGTNYMNVAGLMAIERDDALYVQACDDFFYVAWKHNGVFHSERLAFPQRSLSVRGIFHLQGIDLTPSGHKKGLLQALCKKYRFQFSKEYVADIAIGGIHFDAVWNQGDNNKLCLLVINTDPERGDQESRLAETRNLLNLVSGKKPMKRLYDRDIVVAEANDDSRERLEKEGKDKLRVYKGHPASLKYDLEEILFPPPKTSVKTDALRFDDLRGSVLLTIIGKNPDPTLLAMKTHKAAEVLLCATTNVDEVNELASLLMEKSEEYGLGRVRVIPSSIEGDELPDIIPVVDAPVVVNISPGTKGQGAFLALWAKKHGHEVWGIEGEQKRMICLSDLGKTIPLPKPPLELLLHCQSKGRIMSYGLSNEDDAWKLEQQSYSDMLGFMREVDNAGLWEKFIPAGSRRETLEVGDLRLKFRSKTEFLLLRGIHEKNESILLKDSLQGGGLYEKLVGQALAEAYPEIDFRLNLETKRDTADDNYNRLTELDVVACTQFGKQYVISCKSCPQNEKELTETAEQVRSTAKTLSRFAVPLLASLYVRGIRKLQDVVVVGPDVLCRPQKLHEALVEAEKLVHSR